MNAALEDPSVWNDPKKAQELGKEKKALDGVVVTLDDLARELSDNTELFEMSKEEGDEAGLLTIEAEGAKLAKMVEDLEFRRMFSNPMDPNHCFIDIQAGAGGTEAQDWASMLLRMYLRWCERRWWRALWRWRPSSLPDHHWSPPGRCDHRCQPLSRSGFRRYG